MPLTAIETGQIDFALTPEQIREKIISFGRSKFLKETTNNSIRQDNIMYRLFKRNDIMKYIYIWRVMVIFLSAILFFSLSVQADDENTTVLLNISENNQTSNDGGIEYPEEGLQAADGLDYGISVQGYADVGRVSTGFSGSSIEARGGNQTPSAVMTFSDKSSVSGFIKNFMKSFHWESGIDM